MEIEIRVNNSIHDTIKMMSTEIENYNDEDIEVYDYYTLNVNKSRIVWYGLVPLLLDAPYNISKYAIQCIIINQQNHFNDSLCRHHHHHHHHHSSNIKEEQPSSASSSSIIAPTTKIRRLYRRRKFKWTTMDNPSIITRKSSNQQLKPKQRRRRIVIYIQPIHITQYEYYYESLLLYYEHTIIRYISILGYISTLGGGYFLCHHYNTAIQLAKIQQKIALILNDIVLYYTCYIHISYNYIYNGQFHSAKFILYHVIQHIISMNNNNTNTNSSNNTNMETGSSSNITTSTTTTTTTNTININNIPSKYYILLQMCYSALLFCKRMSKFVQTTNQHDSINKKRKTRTIHTIPTLVQMSSSLQQQQQQQQQFTSSTYNHQHHQHHHPYDQNHTDTTNNTNYNNNNVNNNKIMIQKMIDNYHRIRIKQDQSKKDDFIIPFSKAIQNI